MPDELRSGGAEPHLHEAHDAGGGACCLRARADRARDRVRQHEARGEADDHLRRKDHRRSALRLDQDPHDTSRRAEHGDGNARADHRVHAVLRRPAARGEIPHHVDERKDDEPHAVFGGRAVHHRDHDMRRAADEGEEHRRIEG